MYKKNSEKQFFFVLFIGLGILILALTRGEYLYGSVTDWATQHYRIPEYFRNLFYQTHDLFPDFAFHLGAGQNIYYLSYYGLFSPIILLSYFLPFISMQNYIIISTILSFFCSILLFYQWIKRRYNQKQAYFLTLLFALATPLLFHSHRHIMFMNYMPFLLMGFLGVDVYFEKKKSALLILGTFLMIMTSYFFSVSGIFALTIYGIYKYIEVTDKRTLGSYFKEGVPFAGCIIISIGMAGILLFPTLYTIVSGRGSGNSIDIISLLCPTFRLTDTLYGGYAFGLTSILFLAILYGIGSKQCEKRFLAILLMILLSFPICLYILNGGMYVNGKVLIPFIPLALLCVADVLYSKSLERKYILFYGIISLLVVWLNVKNEIVFLFLLDVLFTLFLLYLRKKTTKDFIVPVGITFLALITCLYSNYKDTLVKKGTMDYQDVVTYMEEKEDVYRTGNIVNPLNTINQVMFMNEYKTSIYSSTSNAYYKDFYNRGIHNEFKYRSREILATPNNFLSNIYLGNKYIIAKELNQIGYESVYGDTIKVFENDNVFSIGYSTAKVMSEREFNTLSYPQQIDALLHYTIIHADIEDVYESRITPISLDFDVKENEVEITRSEDSFSILSSKNNSRLLLDINNKEALQNKILLVQFTITNTSGVDRSITIGGIENKVTKKGWKYHNENYTFEYTIASDEIDSLEVIFSKGNYEINDINFYVFDRNDILSIQKDTHDAFVIDKKKTKGDYIEGAIDVIEDGYFSISIPYDKGFTIYVDGEEIAYEKVNNNFIGFQLRKGEHQIVLEYHSPYKHFGSIISIVGSLAFVFCVIKDKKRYLKS